VPGGAGHAAAAVVVVLLLAACGSAPGAAEGEVLPASAIAAEDDPGLVHVHGLGVNPGDGDVYAATHFGLWRVPAEGDVHRVADSGHDFMGFTVVSRDNFVASGHPLLTDDIPPLMGLVESTDAGRTWRSLSLLGEADFHALRAAHGAVWGWNSSDGGFMVSEDREQWDRRSTVSSLVDFAVDPADAEHVVAVTADDQDALGMQRSGDGGRTWEPVDAAPPLVRVAWEEKGTLWAAGQDGAVWRSVDGGAQWEQRGEVPAAPEAFAADGDTLLVAAGGAILQSDNGGESWDELYRAPVQ